MKTKKLHRNAGRTKPTRDQRRQLMAEYGVTSGRQWVRLRKGLQRAVRKAERDRDEFRRRALKGGPMNLFWQCAISAATGFAVGVVIGKVEMWLWQRCRARKWVGI